MKKIHISFYDEVYRDYFEIFFGFNTIKEVKKCKIYTKEFWSIIEDEENFYKDCSGMFICGTVSNKKSTSRVNFIFVKQSSKNIMLKTLIHETLHATLSVMRSAGVQLNENDGGEAYTHYQEMLVDKVLSKL